MKRALVLFGFAGVMTAPSALHANCVEDSGPAPEIGEAVQEAARLVRRDPAVSAAVQRRTLHAVLEAVEAQAGKHDADPAEPRPVVQVDLDLSSLRPITRTIEGLRSAEVPEFPDPATLPLLPGYTNEAYAEWLRVTAYGEKYPAIRGAFGDGPAYWNTHLIDTDEVTPGFKEFVEAVESRGGIVVLNSGRFTEGVRAQSLRSFEREGLSKVNLLIGNPDGLSDAGLKAARQAEVGQRWGKTVAIIDDRISNRTAMIAALGDPSVLSVGIAIPGFSHDPVVESNANRISTFELDP